MGDDFDYDLFVIGGGSGGLSAAKIASDHGAKTALADFVKPTPKGTKWGLGGTCVNVGCIPKKLMHFSALSGESIHDAKNAGWNINENSNHNWEQMVQKITLYIKSLNFSYKQSLKTKKVTYFNKLAKLVSKNKIQLTDAKGNIQYVTSKYILIAVGGRPSYPSNIPNAKQIAITSDDIFSLKTNPGRTLIIGASYISLECAGFLKGFGCQVSIMVRSILLRGFDQQIANMIGDYMKNMGINFIENSIPTKFVKKNNNKIEVEYQTTSDQKFEACDIFDTVLFAIGRTADTLNLGLDQVGVIYNKKNLKIIANQDDSTNINNIFSIGDCTQGRTQLTPTAIMAGKLLANRLFNNQSTLMSYKLVATTVFTPIQYGSIGLSEQEAIKQNTVCYAKLICNSQDNNRVIGFHYLGPNAGEITQGYSVAMNLGATKEDFDKTVGIHPTISQVQNFILISKNWEAKL